MLVNDALLNPGDEARVGIVINDTGRFIEVKITREDRNDGTARLIIDVPASDTALVAIRTPEIANWAPS